MADFTVRSGFKVPYGASFLTDGNGNFVADPTWNNEYKDSAGAIVVATNGLSYTFYDKTNTYAVNNPGGYMLAPDYLATASGFAKAVNDAVSLPTADWSQRADLIETYYENTKIFHYSLSSPQPDSLETLQGYVLFGPGNPQLNPTGQEFTVSIVSPFTGIASYEFGAIAAARNDGLEIIEEAGVFNSWLGGRNQLGFERNPERNTIEFLAGIQAVENNQFPGILYNGGFPFAWSIGLDTTSAITYFKDLENGNTMDSSIVLNNSGPFYFGFSSTLYGLATDAPGVDMLSTPVPVASSTNSGASDLSLSYGGFNVDLADYAVRSAPGIDAPNLSEPSLVGNETDVFGSSYSAPTEGVAMPAEAGGVTVTYDSGAETLDPSTAGSGTYANNSGYNGFGSPTEVLSQTGGWTDPGATLGNGYTQLDVGGSGSGSGGDAPINGSGSSSGTTVSNSGNGESDSNPQDNPSYNGNDYGDPSSSQPDGSNVGPVVLDLTGKGIKLTPLSSSNNFYDMTGDGYQHRTAWAAAGNGVLVLDVNNSGQITQQNQVVFTDWDSSAKTDMQALAAVFDTNHNGMLDAGDTDWSLFKIMVTNADGTTTLKTLAQLGITVTRPYLQHYLDRN